MAGFDDIAPFYDPRNGFCDTVSFGATLTPFYGILTRVTEDAVVVTAGQKYRQRAMLRVRMSDIPDAPPARQKVTTNDGQVFRVFGADRGSNNLEWVIHLQEEQDNGR